MSAGDTKIMSDTARKDRSGLYSLTDNWQIVFFTDTFASISSETSSPTSSTYTVAIGGNFVANYP